MVQLITCVLPSEIKLRLPQNVLLVLWALSLIVLVLILFIIQLMHKVQNTAAHLKSQSAMPAKLHT